MYIGGTYAAKLTSLFTSVLTMYQRRLKLYPLRYLQLVGQNPLTYNFYSKISVFIILLCVSLMCPLIFIKIMQEFDNVDVLVPSLEALMSFYQVKI